MGRLRDDLLPRVRALVERFGTESHSDFSAKLSNFRVLVLFCMDSYDSETGLIFQRFSRSTVAPIGRKKVQALFFARKKRTFGGERLCGQGALKHLMVSVDAGFSVALRVQPRARSNPKFGG